MKRIKILCRLIGEFGILGTCKFLALLKQFRNTSSDEVDYVRMKKSGKKFYFRPCSSDVNIIQDILIDWTGGVLNMISYPINFGAIQE